MKQKLKGKNKSINKTLLLTLSEEIQFIKRKNCETNLKLFRLYCFKYFIYIFANIVSETILEKQGEKKLIVPRK